MKNLAKFSVEKAITVFMAVIIVAIFGVVSFTRLTTDLFPSMNIPYGIVVTPYIGASPEEVELGVTNPLEETLSTTTNVKTIESISQENISILMLEFEADANMDSAVIEMRENLDMITSNLPDEVGNPMIIKINPDMMPIMAFSVSADLSQEDLTTLVNEEVLPQVERIPGVASVSVSGAFESELQVVLNEERITQYEAELSAMADMLEGTSPEMASGLRSFEFNKELVSMMLQGNNFEFPVGYANIDNGEGTYVNYLVRVGDDFESKEEIENLAFLNLEQMSMFLPDASTGALLNKDNPVINLHDISTITFVNANDKEYSKVNGENSITITVQKSSSFATTDVTNMINQVLSDISEEQDTEFTILLDQGEFINMSTGSVVTNLLIGATLAVAVLVLFLRNARATFIVGVAIPISLLFAIVLIYLSGITLNIVSLGGLALGIGMLVDNSIVVMENIFRLKKQGLSNKEAAIKGTAQVGGAITASTLTTISVFLPIIFIEGFIKEIFIQMAMTIAFSLSASLMIALTLVPSVSSRVLKEDMEIKDNEEKVISKIKGVYERVFKFAFKYYIIILIAVVGLFGLSIYLATNQGLEYFPESDEGQITIAIENPDTTPLTFEDFVQVLDDLNEDLALLDDVETIGITLGGGQMMFLGVQDADSASVNVILKSDRSNSTLENQAIISDLLEDKYTVVESSVSGTQNMTSALTGEGIQLQLKGYDLTDLRSEALDLAEQVQTVDGVSEVDSGVGKVTTEFKITVDKDEALANMLSVAQVLLAVREYIEVEQATSTLNISGNQYEIFVYDSHSVTDDSHFTTEEILDLEVLNPLNMLIPIRDVITEEETGFVPGMEAVNHVDGTRVVTVSIMLEEGENIGLVAQDVNELLEDYEIREGLELEVQGENEEIMEAMEVLLLAVGLGIVLIYMIMASQFQSLTYPFIIMFTIPLAFTGGFLILWITGLPVSVVALIGLIILTGVVVNNGIVLVDYTNQLRESGMDIKEALLEAGKTRLRPIIMTALTTILALTTMALGFGEGSEMMQPMAVTTIGGLIYATLLTLVVVPIMYYLITNHGKLITSIIFAMLTVVITPIAYIMLGGVYIIVIGSVLFVGFIVLAFLPSKKVKVVG